MKTAFIALVVLSAFARAAAIECDLLVVGGNESAVAAAVRDLPRP